MLGRGKIANENCSYPPMSQANSADAPKSVVRKFSSMQSITSGKLERPNAAKGLINLDCGRKTAF